MKYYFCHYCHNFQQDDFSDKDGFCNVCAEMLVLPKPILPPFTSFQEFQLHLQDGDPDGYLDPEKLREYEAGILTTLDDFPDKEITFPKKGEE